MTQSFERPSPEVSIARLEVMMTTMQRDLTEFRADTKIAHSELQSSMRALESRERERNGQIKDLAQYRKENEQHWGEHMTWAAERANVLAGIQAAQHDGSVRSGVWRSQLKFVLGGGGGGSLITAAIGGALWFFNVI